VDLILLLIICLFFLIHTPPVQNFLVNKVTSYLSDELAAKVEIDRVNFSLFHTFVLEGVYVEDLNQDTLIYLNRINFDFDRVDYPRNEVYLKGIGIEGGLINLNSAYGTGDMNFQFILDYFTADKKSTDTAAVWNYHCTNIAIFETDIKYRDYNDTSTIGGVNFADLYLQNTNLSLKNLNFDTLGVDVEISHLSLLEKSGFQLDTLEAFLVFDDKGVQLSDIKLVTPRSGLAGEFQMDYNDIKDFDDFTTKVRLKTEFVNSKISTEDLEFFIPQLEGFDKEIWVSGKIRGEIDGLKGKNIEIFAFDETYFKGDFNVFGLTDNKNMLIELEVDSAQTSAMDLKKIPLPPFSEGKTLNLPDNMDDLGLVTFSGFFNGFATDFTAYAEANTEIGYLSTDVKFAYNQEEEEFIYSGTIVPKNFDIGKR